MERSTRRGSCTDARSASAARSSASACRGCSEAKRSPSAPACARGRGHCEARAAELKLDVRNCSSAAPWRSGHEHELAVRSCGETLPGLADPLEAERVGLDANLRTGG